MNSEGEVPTRPDFDSEGSPCESDWLRALDDIPFFAERFLGISLHPGQREWLLKSLKPENLLVAGNRWGKSFSEAIKIIHHAIFRCRDLRFDSCGKYHIVTASLTLDQARIIFNAILRIMNNRRGLRRLISKTTASPYPRIVLGNGSIIEARSTQRRGEYLLGNDYDYFIFDEVAFDDNAEYVVDEVIKMRLADRKGKLDLVSTPNGKNWFYRKMKELKDRPESGYVHWGDSRENSFISYEYLETQMKYLSDKRVAQNIMGQFVDSGGEIVASKYIDQALLPGVPRAGLFIPRRDLGYISGWDLARKNTATVGITVEIENGVCTVVELSRIKRWDWNVIISSIRNRQLRIPGRLVIDATGLGDVVVSQLGDLNPTAVIFTPKSKAELLTNLEIFHAAGRVKYHRWEIPDEGGKVWSLEDELRSARWDDNNRCDSLMALALALWPLRRPDHPTIAPRMAKI
jgi:hypothetical protein